MIPEIGHFALVLALATAIVQTVVPLAGAQTGRLGWMALARPGAWALFVLNAIAFACLTWAFVAKDFSVLYVATNSNAELPLFYRVSAVWGAHEGSLLLWSFILSGWMVAVAWGSRRLPPAFSARVLGVMAFVAVGFLLFMLLTSNPFERLIPAAARGRDLNPLLQDPGLIVHPPMLYMGYVGLSVPFAFAIAALLEGRIDAAWTRWTRPWTNVAWIFLTLGITLGSWWAYYELGWGGWWFWDPVENASFMPWLVATALIHSLAVTEKRGAFRAWTVLLAVFGFSLSLLGTFLVRSGVLVSVHAFATDPARGTFILAFLAVVIGGALLLYAWRASAVAGGGSFAPFSRETLLLVNNVLLVVAAATVLLGTLYPLIVEALGLGKISVGPPYFSSVFVPLMLPLVFLVGVGPLVRWKRDRVARIFERLRLWLALSLVLGLALVALFWQPFSMGAALGTALALWVAFSTWQSVRERLRGRERGLLRGILSLPGGFVGMTIAHLGLGVFVVGVTLVTAYSAEKDARLAPGERYELAGYSFLFEGVHDARGPNYRAERGVIRVFDGEGEQIALLHPEKRHYAIQPQPMTEAGIDPGLTRDVYVSLGEPLGDGAWSVRIYYRPFVRWIWLGGLLMAIGGLIAAADRRYRLRGRAPAGELRATGALSPDDPLAALLRELPAGGGAPAPGAGAGGAGS